MERSSNSALQCPEPSSTSSDIVEDLLRPVAEHNAKLQATTPVLPVQQYQSPYASTPAESIPAIAPRVSSVMTNPVFSDQVNELLARVRASMDSSIERGSSQWDAAREAVMREVTSQTTTPTFSTQSSQISSLRKETKTGGRRGRGPRPRVGLVASTSIHVESPQSGGLSNGPSPGHGTSSQVGRVNRGGRPRGSRAARGSTRGGKRKRADGEDEKMYDTDSSETFTSLPTQSRSGRKIFQATTTMPVMKIDDEIVEPALSPHGRPMINGSTKQKKGRARRTPGAAAVCKNCGRGHSPSGNMIVFCDGCNTPWHQHCHDPVIKGEVLHVVEEEWFCADCTILREGKDLLQGRVSGEHMSLAEKRQYLHTLPQDHLVSLLLHACSLHPRLRIFPTKGTRVLATDLSSGAVDTTALVNDFASTAIAEAEDEYYEEDDVLPYPKAGNGIQLPPESEDINILLDDDIVTFSHSWMKGSTILRASKSFTGLESREAVGIGA